MADDFTKKLDEFEHESERFDLQQKIDRLQFAVDFWANAENETNVTGSTRSSYHRRRLMAEGQLHLAREQQREHWKREMEGLVKRGEQIPVQQATAKNP
jgi:hypothetical protein